MKVISRKVFSRLPSSLRSRLDPFDAAIGTFITRAASSLERGSVVLDAGAGEARHAVHFKHLSYIPVDSLIGDKEWDYSRLAAAADLHQLPFRTGTFDAVLCVVVLEHVREPLAVLKEIHRVLKRGAKLWLVTPMLWEEHQKPHDYFRFTSDGLCELLRRADFQVAELSPVGGFFWVFGRRCINLLSFFQEGWKWPLFIILAPLFGLLFPLLCYLLDFLDRERRFSLGHTTIASAC